MTLPFASWTAWLAAAQKGPVTLPPAVRGQFYGHRLVVSGDFSAATLTAQVRAEPDAASALATFTIGTPSYDAEADETTWEFSLAAGTGANSTGALPADGNKDGIEFFVYDFLLEPDGEPVERLIGGLLPVSGFVTEPA